MTDSSESSAISIYPNINASTSISLSVPPINQKAVFGAFKSPDRQNIKLHSLYVRKQFEECKQIINEILSQYDDILCENQLVLRATIAREEAYIRESIRWLERAHRHNPRSNRLLYELGKNHYMLAEHQRAIELFSKALERETDDWKIFYWQSLSYYHVFRPPVCMQKARLLGEQNDIVPAVEAYKRSIEMEPENVDLIYSLGMLYLKAQSEENAFAMLGKTLTFEANYVPSILAIASVLQTHGDFDVALSKYKIAANEFDHSAALWNNIGMCYFGKGKLVAAISCLNKANYLCPLDWKILFNLSLVYFSMRQFASAYHFVILTALEDFRNAKSAYKRALKLNPELFISRLNFAIFEYRRGNVADSIKRIGSFLNDSSNGLEEIDQLTSRFKACLQKTAEEDQNVADLLERCYNKEFDVEEMDS